MKRLLLLLLSALAIMPIAAQNILTIHQKDGQQFSFGFSEKPVITYTENEMVLTTTRTTVKYPLSSIAKLTFPDTGTGVEETAADTDEAKISLDSYTVRISGAKSGQNVFVTDASGKTLSTYETDQDGSVTFSIADLPQGIYIIKSESLTCKILKQ